MASVRIIGIGSYLPAQRLSTGAAVERIKRAGGEADTSSEWILRRTGIAERRMAETLPTVSLAFRASVRALKQAGLRPKDLNLICVPTITAEERLPITAPELQRKLGVSRLGRPAFNISAACSGFVYGLAVLVPMMRDSPRYQRALLVCAERLSRHINWSDRGTAPLFADGAGAVALERTDEDGVGVLAVNIGANGEAGTAFTLPVQGSITMDGARVFELAVEAMVCASREVLAEAKLATTDLAAIVPHQANLRIMTAVAKRLGAATDQLITTIREHGNTSAASIPLALDWAVKQGRIKPGDLVLTPAFGGGATWGAALIRW
ncbi:beta-ketoacyl-ACP synthase 3 [Candidatus Parcubacteria bacterium]|nr:beta-ketoacyl-ACP synthase 3 [Candidatus Parcubacteria bacterium]